MKENGEIKELAFTEYELPTMQGIRCLLYMLIYIVEDLPLSFEVGYPHFHLKKEEAKAWIA